MAIEMSNAAHGVKAASGSVQHNKSAGKLDAAAGGAAGGFLNLMMSFSAVDADIADTASEPAIATSSDTGSDALQDASILGQFLAISPLQMPSLNPVLLTPQGSELIVAGSHTSVAQGAPVTLSSMALVGSLRPLQNGVVDLKSEVAKPAFGARVNIAPEVTVSDLPTEDVARLDLETQTGVDLKPAQSPSVEKPRAQIFAAADAASAPKLQGLVLPQAMPEAITPAQSRQPKDDVALAPMFGTTTEPISISGAKFQMPAAEKLQAEIATTRLFADAASAPKIQGLVLPQAMPEAITPAQSKQPKDDVALAPMFGTATDSISRSEALFVVPPASETVPESAVAETVSYWVTHGVQTAELKLEGFGESPVEVSIRLSNDQAQIDFATDQLGVREVLEAARSQLEELLASQGLALAGMSVGTSGQWASAGDHRQPEQDLRKTNVVKATSGSDGVQLTQKSLTGGGLDVFV